MLLSLLGCSNKPPVEYQIVEVPVPVEVVTVIKQPHQCEMPEAELSTWGDLLIAYKELHNSFEICLISLQ
jgi:hypothetical protein